MEELGLHAESIGSPWQAAGSSFVAFTVGAIVPLVPWIIGSGTGAIVASVVAATILSAVVGVCWPGSPNGRWCSPGRQVLITRLLVRHYLRHRFGGGCQRLRPPPPKWAVADRAAKAQQVLN